MVFSFGQPGGMLYPCWCWGSAGVWSRLVGGHVGWCVGLLVSPTVIHYHHGHLVDDV